MSARKALNIAETAEVLGIHPQTVRTLVRDGRLKAVRVGRRWLIPVSAIDEFLAPPKRKYTRWSPLTSEQAQAERLKAAWVVERAFGDPSALPPAPPKGKSL